jgi:hypothetical protein
MKTKWITASGFTAIVIGLVSTLDATADFSDCASSARYLREAADSASSVESNYESAKSKLESAKSDYQSACGPYGYDSDNDYACGPYGYKRQEVSDAEDRLRSAKSRLQSARSEVQTYASQTARNCDASEPSFASRVFIALRSAKQENESLREDLNSCRSSKTDVSTSPSVGPLP